MKIETKYDIKGLVYLVHDPDQLQRYITEIHIITPTLRRYKLSCGIDSSDHYEHELSKEKNEALAILKKQDDSDQ